MRGYAPQGSRFCPSGEMEVIARLLPPLFCSNALCPLIFVAVDDDRRNCTWTTVAYGNFIIRAEIGVSAGACESFMHAIKLTWAVASAGQTSRRYRDFVLQRTRVATMSRSDLNQRSLTPSAKFASGTLKSAADQWSYSLPFRQQERAARRRSKSGVQHTKPVAWP